MKGRITFMTWNLYVGADLGSIYTAEFNELPQRVTEVFRQFLATKFPERVKEIARQIALNKPDIIGLQEAELWLLQVVPVPSLPIVKYNFIKLLLKELRKIGLHYEVAATNDNAAASLLSSEGNSVSLLDRNTILVRKRSGLQVIQSISEEFQKNLEVTIGGQLFLIVRGWSYIDVKANGRVFRVINTHLEPLSEGVQIAQGNEILNGPAKTNLPVIVLGDLNSDADGTGTPTYGNFRLEGFGDVWEGAGQGDGFTCCQDADLLNGLSLLNRRIDFILFKNGWMPIRAERVGGDQSDRTPTALWPSDHAGMVGTLFLP
ncbi:endonuclease/exonuclease/phosphatase family protein [Bacillus sp. JJ1532]|uniref:endonuclease/exonuclease/phosphatase family protein n=1 Tax=unclassified Bacillus (in: firmicutes) TaxID=185979 RepID=UPI002FFDC8FE